MTREQRTWAWGEEPLEASASGQPLSELPVPSIAKRKMAAEYDADRQPAKPARAGRVEKRRRLWRAVVAVPASVAPAAPGAVQPVVSHAYVGQAVRAVGEGLSAGVIGRIFTVQEARSRPDGTVDLRMQGDCLQVRYATVQQVQLLSSEAQFAKPGPVHIDYRQLNAVQRRGLAVRLSVPVKLREGELMDSGVLQWAVAEIQYRLPVPVNQLEIVHTEEAKAVCAMQLDSGEVWGQLQDLRSRLQCSRTVLVLLHSEGPSHYTLLRRQLVGSQCVVTYWDSLRVPSESGRAVALKLMDRLCSGSSLPVPNNHRFQTGGWECGIFTAHFQLAKGALRQPAIGSCGKKRISRCFSQGI